MRQGFSNSGNEGGGGGGVKFFTRRREFEKESF